MTDHARALEALKNVGQRMSNWAYNVSQNAALAEGEGPKLMAMAKEWDAALAALAALEASPLARDNERPSTGLLRGPADAGTGARGRGKRTEP